ncbi:hypothetical protein LOK49_LG10G02190 [Camellia lanceoleosa]|uniref:Uncharacterized protein n=1 Tax=Camellia lanceoleosa TaxID=1840588 RepID=A0ACC0GBS5_9ERIC|nr:hypothetical protein LOK49_LG10G02190 [Camellia lanceoleosa]
MELWVELVFSELQRAKRALGDTIARVMATVTRARLESPEFRRDEEMASHVLTRVHSFRDHLDGTFSTHRNELFFLLSKIERHGKGILKPHQIEVEFEALPKHAQHKLHDETFGEVLKSAQSCQTK